MAAQPSEMLLPPVRPAIMLFLSIWPDDMGRFASPFALGRTCSFLSPNFEDSCLTPSGAA